ncbi:MAG: DUF1329 domain-containing protein [Burkholderiaceae bacterium]
MFLRIGMRRHLPDPSRRLVLTTGLKSAAAGLAVPVLTGHATAASLSNTVDTSNRHTFHDLLPAGLGALVARYPAVQFTVTSAEPFASGVPSTVTASFKEAPARIESEANRALVHLQRHLYRPRPVNLYREGRAIPVRPDGSFYEIRYWSHRVDVSVMAGAPEKLWFAVKGGYLAPSSLRGDSLLVHEFIPPAEDAKAADASLRQAWIYKAGSRRVRRAPDLAYDAVSDGSEGMITADQVDGFNGATDRYEWSDLGEATRLIPFSMLKHHEASLPAKALLGQGSLANRFLRLEPRTVYRVEARLRPGQRHIYARRMFYIDAQTSTVVMEEAFDTRGGLWRVALHGLGFNPLLGVVQTRVSVYHDLLSGSYFVTGLDPESGPVFDTTRPAQWNDFQPDALRRQGR